MDLQKVLLVQYDIGMALRSPLARWLEKHPDMKQTDFASLSGLPQSQVSLYVSGRSPGLDNALAIERATAGEVPAKAWKAWKQARAKVAATPDNT